MTVPLRRLQNQLLAAHDHKTPHEVVSHFGAMQAQDYLGALWAIGVRLGKMTEEDVERDVAQRRIVRCWPMRGTLHFVAAADVRWMIELLSARVLKRHRTRLERDFELDPETMRRARTIVESALERERALTRLELYALLDESSISTAGSRGLHILFALAHERLLCFGPRRGKQPTFVLLDEWLPAPSSKSREEALGELARRYFTSHGPASAADFAWWSGLTAKEANEGVALAADAIEVGRRDSQAERTVQPQYLARSGDTRQRSVTSPNVHLLPPFDEYTVAYKDRGAILDTAFSRHLNAGGGMLSPVLVIDGRVAGTWKRTLRGRDGVEVSITTFEKLTANEVRGVEREAARYASFLQRDAGAKVTLNDAADARRASESGG
jgi:hypothetical protein